MAKVTEYKVRLYDGSVHKLRVEDAEVIDTEEREDFAPLTCTCCGSHKVVAVSKYKVYQCAEGCMTLDPGTTDGQKNVYLRAADEK
jgi:hypothetical protein